MSQVSMTAAAAILFLLFYYLFGVLLELALGRRRLNSRLTYESPRRIRIADYKDKLELAKESRKESTSYVLFLLAGIPILYTFQVFIFPWVKEGQKLFESLG